MCAEAGISLMDGTAAGTKDDGIAPVRAAVSSHIECQFEATPHSEFVKSIAQVILDDLLGSADHISDFAISLPFPHQHRDLNFLGG